MLYCHGSFRWRNVEKAQELAKGAAYFCFHYKSFMALMLVK